MWFNPNFSINAYQEEGPIDQIIDSLLHMLEKDVVDNSKSCAEYFEFFRNYSSSVSHSCYGKHICMLNYMYMTCHTATRLPSFDSQGCFCSLHEFLTWIFKAYTQTGNPVIPKQRVN